MNTKAVGVEKRVIFLRGKKTVLRPLGRADVPELLRGLNDPEVSQFVIRGWPLHEAEEEEWIENLPKRKDDLVLAIETAEGDFIGVIGLHKISRQDRTATLGASIFRKDHWGQGYGTDATMAILAYAFLALNLRKVNAEIYDFNQRSLAYSKKCGAVEEGRQKLQVWRQSMTNGNWDEGAYHDVVLIGIFREDWLTIYRKWKER